MQSGGHLLALSGGVDGSVCLTGASGFLGGRVLARLVADGCRVACLGRWPPAPESRSVEFIPGDLLDREACRRAMDGCRAVVHLAAATGKHRRAEYFRVNAEGTGVLVSEAQRAGIARFLFVSTIAAKFEELTHYPYAQSKREAERIVSASGLNWTIVRPTMIFGPGAPVLEGLRRLAALPIVPVFGNGRAPVQPIFVDDLACALKAVLDDPGAVRRAIEIGGPDTRTIEELLLDLRVRMAIGNRRVMHLPAGPIRAVLGMAEPLLLPWLPVTAGQLATFTNDGTAAPDALTAQWQAGMRKIDDMYGPA
jgi:nucleoside-diphosphate-sugar epimerase